MLAYRFIIKLWYHELTYVTDVGRLDVSTTGVVAVLSEIDFLRLENLEVF